MSGYEHDHCASEAIELRERIDALTAELAQLRQERDAAKQLLRESQLADGKRIAEARADMLAAEDARDAAREALRAARATLRSVALSGGEDRPCRHCNREYCPVDCPCEMARIALAAPESGEPANLCWCNDAEKVPHDHDPTGWCPLMPRRP